jgi:hypothetical protein
MRAEKSVGWLTAETEVLGENLPQCHFVHHKSHVTWRRSGSEPGWLEGKLTTTALSNASACQRRVTLRESAWTSQKHEPPQSTVTRTHYGQLLWNLVYLFQFVVQHAQNTVTRPRTGLVLWNPVYVFQLVDQCTQNTVTRPRPDLLL